MKDPHDPITLSIDELRELAAFAATCAEQALPIFEQYAPEDHRPREAIAAARTFVSTGKRSNTLRAAGLAAYKASRAAQDAPAAMEAALAATQAVGAAYLHPLFSALQVKHILGSAAHAARAAELAAGDDQTVGVERCTWAQNHASKAVHEVLQRYPAAPPGGGRSGELLRQLDATLRTAR